MKHYLIETVDKLPIYKTPEPILKYMKLNWLERNLTRNTLTKEYKE